MISKRSFSKFSIAFVSSISAFSAQAAEAGPRDTSRELARAIEAKDVAKMRELLIAGVDANRLDHMGEITPLHHAVSMQCLECVKTLVEVGKAKVEYQRSPLGLKDSPFMEAMQSYNLNSTHLEMAEYLVDKTLPNERGVDSAPLVEALSFIKRTDDPKLKAGGLRLATKLLERGADVKDFREHSASGWQNALRAAISTGSIEAVELILAKVDPSEDAGLLRVVAMANENPKAQGAILALLIKRGIDMTEKDRGSGVESAVQYAVGRSRSNDAFRLSAELLLKYGAKPAPSELAEWKERLASCEQRFGGKHTVEASAYNCSQEDISRVSTLVSSAQANYKGLLPSADELDENGRIKADRKVNRAPGHKINQ